MPYAHADLDRYESDIHTPLIHVEVDTTNPNHMPDYFPSQLGLSREDVLPAGRRSGLMSDISLGRRHAGHVATHVMYVVIALCAVLALLPLFT